MNTNPSPNTDETPAYKLVLITVNSIDDAAKKLLDAFSKTGADYGPNFKWRTSQAVGRYVLQLEDPSQAIAEVRNKICDIGSRDRISPDIIGQARALASGSYLAGKRK